VSVATRVIPCLDVDAGRVVKGVNFLNLRDAGDPVELAKLYGEQGADELTFLDVTANSGNRETTYDIVGRDMLQTPELGEIEAFHLKPRPIANPRGNITAEMWFAPSLGFLPVRIRVNMGEDTHVDLMVLRIEQR